jgi:hypothetical protein
MNANRTFAFFLLAGGLLAGGAAALGAVVQLPTFSHFGVSTTVEVPDSGGGLAGGVDRSASGGNEVGGPLSPWRNSAIGSQQGTSCMHLAATIHDFQAMDEALLAQGRGLGRTPGIAPARENPLASAGKDSAPVPLAEIRAQRRQKELAERAEWEELLAQGARAADAGKLGAARAYYKMVLRRASADLQKEAAARLALLQKPPAVSKVAKETPSGSPNRQ